METAIAHGTISYMRDLKHQGVIRHIGLSSHTPEVVEKVLDMHILDMLIQHQPRLRLPSREICHWQRGRTGRALPPVRSGGRGHFGNEGV